jgi:hypothetical protein
MIKIGDYVMDMGDFLHWSKLILTESLKYLSLLMFSVLAIRLWRRMPKLTAGNQRSNFVLALASTALACGIGYFSFCQSMSRLYEYYGMRAFESGYMLSAYSLFAKSAECWKTPDALGNEGVCLLWLDQPVPGARLLAEAKAMRRGDNPKFEDFYEGLYYFFHDQTDKAVPLLESASADLHYYESVAKLFAVIKLDQNQPQEAEALMKPMRQNEVTDPDQAYVIASLDLIEGNKTNAAALWKKFSSTNLPPYWKSRFDKLGAKIQNP